MRGQVVRVISGFYDIVIDDKEYRVRGSGNLRKEEQSPLVGDFVEFEENGMLTKIYPRANSLVRPKVANIDQAVIVTSLKEPNYSSILLNKFLAIIEASSIKPVILFTKRDLVDSSPKEEYVSQGYEVYEISNNDVDSLNELRKIFKDKLTVFTGQTGAGKSTTINNLADTNIKTQEISKALGRGKHTTRVVEIIPWNHGRLIDTPGFSSLEFNLSKLQLARAYHDFEKLSVNCKFNRTCIHNKENDCAIKDAVKDGTISEQRYLDYIRLLKEANDE